MLSIEAEGAPRLTDNNLRDLHNFLHHAYELVEFNDYFRFVQNISKFLNLTSPWPKTICPFFCKVSECENVEGFPCRYCSRILKMIPDRKWSPKWTAVTVISAPGIRISLGICVRPGIHVSRGYTYHCDTVRDPHCRPQMIPRGKIRMAWTQVTGTSCHVYYRNKKY